MPRTALVATLALVALLPGCLSPAAEFEAPAPQEARESRLTPSQQSASEVSIAADPTDPARVLAAANSGGGFGLYLTTDGGRTWTASMLSAADVAPLAADHGRVRGLSDPVVAWSPDGTAYLAGLAYIPTSAVFVARSDDGGRTFGRAVLVEESDLATSFNDKEWLGVNPTTGTLVLSWQKEPAMDQLRGVDERTGLDVDFGDIVVARSTDGGRTWTEPSQVSEGRHNNGTQVAFTPDGRAHLLWVNYERGTLDLATSDDDGATWSAPRAVAQVAIVPPFERYARMHTLPAFVASPAGPELYAVWHDIRNGDSDILATASLDGGATWLDPVRVHEDPIGNGVQQLYPWAAVDAKGRLHVSFYDTRDDPEHPKLRYWLASTDGPGLAFGPSRPISTAPFTAFTGTDANGASEARSLGDYTGLTTAGDALFAAWADGRGERTHVYAARVPLEW